MDGFMLPPFPFGSEGAGQPADGAWTCFGPSVPWPSSGPPQMPGGCPWPGWPAGPQGAMPPGGVDAEAWARRTYAAWYLMQRQWAGHAAGMPAAPPSDPALPGPAPIPASLHEDSSCGLLEQPRKSVQQPLPAEHVDRVASSTPASVSTTLSSTATTQASGTETLAAACDVSSAHLNSEKNEGCLELDIENAVQNFLAGGDDGFGDSDSNNEEEEEDEDGVDERQSALDGSRTGVGGVPGTYGSAVVATLAAPPGLTPPTRGVTLPPTSEPDAAAAGAAAAAIAAAKGLQPAGARLPGRCGLSAEGVLDFLNVLRRRALPADLADETRLDLAKRSLAAAVTSLYQDRIIPVQSHVARRLREAGGGEAVIQALLPLSARDPTQYTIVPPMSGEQPVILLAQEPAWFRGWVDVEAATGNYSQGVWEALTTLFRDESIALPGQPYQAALYLKQRNVPRLQALTVGELEHMVRLALGRRLLCHHGDQLRPVRAAKGSDFRAQAQRAQTTLSVGMPSPAPSPSRTVHQVAPALATHGQQSGAADSVQPDQDDLTRVLAKLMQQFPDGMPLSKMKQHVQSTCKFSLQDMTPTVSRLGESFRVACSDR